VGLVLFRRQPSEETVTHRLVLRKSADGRGATFAGQIREPLSKNLFKFNMFVTKVGPGSEALLGDLPVHAVVMCGAAPPYTHGHARRAHAAGADTHAEKHKQLDAIKIEEKRHDFQLSVGHEQVAFEPFQGLDPEEPGGFTVPEDLFAEENLWESLHTPGDLLDDLMCSHRVNQWGLVMDLENGLTYE